MPFDRPSTLAWLRTAPRVPVLIIGGGINGAGVLRELALNGVDALLVDRADFASGATGASSRMIHGGLRYLENGEFRLVREALHERNRLLKNAPHCVHPLRTVIPLFSRFSGFGNAARKFFHLGGRPSRRGAWLVRAGLTLYEIFAGTDNTLPCHEVHDANAARALRPGFRPDLIATATYHDAWNPLPERLCLEVIDDATALHAGARALNYCPVADCSDGAVDLRDECSGETYRVRPDMVVNAAGAWVDSVNAKLGASTHWIGGTKGSHLVVDNPDLLAAARDCEIFYENDDGRICLFLPLHGAVLVGTTDVRIDNPDAAVCEEDEFTYLSAAVRQVFPSIEIRRDQVLSSFSGVRPLPESNAGLTGQISRDHEIRELPTNARRAFPVLALIGGKWTTFRALAEQTCDRLLVHLARSRARGSRGLAIGGGRNFPDTGAARKMWVDDNARRHGIPREVMDVLFERHGTRAAGIAAHIAAGGPPFLEGIGPCFAGELDHIARHEAVVHLDDLVLRRSPLGLFGHLNRTRLARVADIVGQALRWSARERAAEIDRCAAILTTRHGVDLDRSPVS